MNRLSLSSTPKRKVMLQKRSASKRPRSHSPVAGKPAKTTSLTVTSNAKTGTIMIDGILAGNIGDKLEVEPGVIKMLIKSPGFKPKLFKVRVTANRENKVTLNLEKPKPKRKPKPRPRPRSRSIARKNRRQPARQEQQNEPDNEPVLPKNDGLFAEPEPQVDPRLEAETCRRNSSSKQARAAIPPPRRQHRLIRRLLIRRLLIRRLLIQLLLTRHTQWPQPTRLIRLIRPIRLRHLPSPRRRHHHRHRPPTIVRRRNRTTPNPSSVATAVTKAATIQPLSRCSPLAQGNIKMATFC